MINDIVTGSNMAFERLEPCAGKLACTVLRGVSSSNTACLLDFAFVARQKRLTIGYNHYYADLVFYHVTLKCYVIVDIKTKPLSHGDLGQMQLYVNYFDQEIKMDDDNPTVGLVLCSEKDDEMVRYLLGDKAKQIFATKYQFHLPTIEELERELKREIKEIKHQMEL